nr:MAG TPA: hypothetical protein [Bacteriophage sp.]
MFNNYFNKFIRMSMLYNISSIILIELLIYSSIINS